MDPAYELNEEELGTISRRLALAFGRRPLLPLQSLQYRLGETGPPRVHPYALRRALGALGRKLNARPVTGTSHRPWEVGRSLFASGELEKPDAIALARQEERHLESIAGCDWHAGYTRFVRALGEHIGKLEEISPSPAPADSLLHNNRLIRGCSRLYRLAPDEAGSELRVWITQEVDHLAPDNPRLWAVLQSCQAASARLLIVARYIDPASFVLFKALGVRGLQYYNMWAPPRHSARMKAAADVVGWFRVEGSEEALAHPVFRQLGGTVKFLRHDEADLRAHEAIALSRDAALAEGSRPTTAVIRWAEEAPVQMPEAWIKTIRRYEAWTSDTPLRIRGTPARSARSRVTTETEHRPGHDASAGTATEPAESTSKRRGTTVTRVPVRGW